MAARTGMTEILSRLRIMTETVASVETVGTADPWTDDALQAILDRKRVDIFDEPLVAVPLYTSGTREYLRYEFPSWLKSATLERDGTSGAFSVVDNLGNAAPTYTIYWDAGYIEFAADTAGTSYYLRARVFDLRGCAAEVWNQKAGLRAKLIQWKAGDHTLYEDQEYDHCIQMAKHYGGGLVLNRVRRAGYR